MFVRFCNVYYHNLKLRTAFSELFLQRNNEKQTEETFEECYFDNCKHCAMGCYSERQKSYQDSYEEYYKLHYRVARDSENK